MNSTVVDSCPPSNSGLDDAFSGATMAAHADSNATASAPGAPPPSVPPRAVYRILYYFNLFDYPVKLDEIASLAGLQLKTVAAAIRELHAEKAVEVQGDYVFFPGRSWIIGDRKRGETFFRAHYQRIRRAAWIISHMPFVRGVFLTGRCSKGLLSDSDDFDFLIVARKDRARLTWILLFLFRRLVSLNYRNGNFRFFCCNYVLGEDVLAVQDRDPFIAMETVFAFPIFNQRLFAEFQRANAWHRRFFQKRARTLPDDLRVGVRLGWLQRLLEIPFDLVWTQGVRQRVEAFYRRRWLKLGIVKDDEDLAQKAGNGYVKPDTGARRRFIVDRVNKLDPAEHHSFLRTKINLHRGLTTHTGAPHLLLTHAGDWPGAEEPVLAGALRAHGYRVEFQHQPGDEGLTRLFREIRSRFIPLVALYVLGPAQEKACRMIRLIHSIGARVVVYGPDAALHTETYLAQEADVVIIGAGQPALLALLDHVSRGTIALEAIPGIQFEGSDQTSLRAGPPPF